MLQKLALSRSMDTLEDRARQPAGRKVALPSPNPGTTEPQVSAGTGQSVVARKPLRRVGPHARGDWGGPSMVKGTREWASSSCLGLTTTATWNTGASLRYQGAAAPTWGRGPTKCLDRLVGIGAPCWPARHVLGTSCSCRFHGCLPQALWPRGPRASGSCRFHI